MKSVRKMSRAGIVMLLCLSMLCCVASADTWVFPDVPDGAPYEEAVLTLAELGVITGDNYGNFNPDKTITRAEAATIICRLLGAEYEAKAMTKVVFSDVPAKHWAVGYVAKAVELGIISGYGNGKFGPADPVTQEQMVKMLVCAWGYGDYALELGGWPRGYVAVAEELGMIESAEGISSAQAKRSLVAEWCYNILFLDTYVEG